ncbi:tetraspanin 36 [Polypterus senegalus]|uniref:tetraspanin 36 n=1 Tax=Polypterus senegalus TaxID=55291 RepID=UPI0019660BB2|nr:tetraspanin 36 [Polypterus senegalus]
MDCGIITSKSILLLLSLIFWAAGAVLAYVGSYVFTSYKNYDHFLEDKYTLLPAVVILGVAVVMFIIGIIGCIATLKESTFGLGFFFVIVFIIFAAEVAAFVLGIVYRGKVKDDIEKSMTEVFNKYDGQNPESRAVDYLQEQVQCCGIYNYTDWLSLPWHNGTRNNTVPLTCCKHNVANCTGRLDQPDDLYTEGCESKLEHLLQDVLSYAMLVILGFAIVKFFGMLSVCVIMCRGRRRDDYQPLYGTYA